MTKKIAYSSPFVPPEWIEAHGMLPYRMMPQSVRDHPSVEIAPGMCTYVHAFINAVVESDADAVVVVTACDQMRRAAELIAGERDLQVFLMHVPTSWQTVGAYKLYISELERLGRFMAALGGDSPSEERLVEAMQKYDSIRAALKDAGSRLSALIADPGALQARSSAPKGVPLALVGGPLLKDHLAVFDFVEEIGAYFALDGTETGERTMPPPFDRRKLRDDPLAALADAYFGAIPDAFRRPNSELYRWLKREIEVRDIRGIVFWRYVWCDTWHAESQRMREWAGLPFLGLDIGDDAGEMNRLQSRLRAFVEVLA